MQFKENNNAIYLQIAGRICDEILAGQLRPGGRISSVREYAAALQVNANTVMRSYDHLTREGIIFNRRGIGFFVADDAPDRIRTSGEKELMEGELAEIFRRLALLNVTPEQLSSLYANYISSTK